MDKNPPIPEIIFSKCETGFASKPRLHIIFSICIGIIENLLKVNECGQIKLN